MDTTRTLEVTRSQPRKLTLVADAKAMHGPLRIQRKSLPRMVNLTQDRELLHAILARPYRWR